jgi:hypothetical protein
MRELLNLIESMLVEGGNVFKNPDGSSGTIRIDQKDIKPTINFIEKITGLDFSSDIDKKTNYPIRWLGSTGKKADSGDLDLAVDATEISKQELVNRLSDWAKKNKLNPNDYVRSRGEIHFKTPINGNPKNGFVQTDFMFFSDVNWGTFYYSGAYNTNYKGAYRNILLSSIAKPLGLKVGNHGLISRASNNVIETDPDHVAEILLGPGHNKEDLINVETIYKNLQNDPDKAIRVKDFEEFLAKENIKPPTFSLTESTGLANRVAGAPFKDSKGNIITFNTLDLFPSRGGKLEKAQLDKQLDRVLNNIQVKWQNERTSKTGGFIIATFDSDLGPLHFGFYRDNIKPVKTDNRIPNKVDDYKLASVSAAKAQSGLSPQDLLTKKDNLTSDDIIDQLINKLGEKNPLVDIAKRVASGEDFPIRFDILKDISFTGFRDYFCEILQPMALQVGQYKGNAGEAAEIFLDDDFGSTTISFDQSKTAGLSDSILVSDSGKYIKISSKGGRGAQASAKNLIESVNELSQTPAGKKLLKKYDDTMQLLREIQRRGQVNAPLYLAVKYDIITEKEANKVLELQNTQPIRMKDIGKLKLGKNLEKIAQSRTPDVDKVSMFYHLLACIAQLAAIEVNDKTDFSKAAADILNNGALVQVYTKLKDEKTTWVLDKFDTVYPGKSIKGVFLSASKNYFSTGIKGNFTFKIVKDETKEEVSKSDNKEKSVDLRKAADIITKGTGKPVSMSPKPKTGVGREKRK